MAKGNTIQERINDIDNSKTAIGAEISKKGVSVPSDVKLADMPSLINAIVTGVPMNGSSSWNCNTLYDTGTYCVASGSNTPNEEKCGTLFVQAYRKPSGNNSPDFATQIYIPNGDSWPDKMYFRTSKSSTWDSWRLIALASNIPTNTNQLTNGAGFITKDVTGLTHYYDIGSINTQLSLKVSVTPGKELVSTTDITQITTNKNNINNITTGYLAKSGGEMTGPITIAAGDGKGILFKNKTSNINIVDGGITKTILGFLNNYYTIGHGSFPIHIRSFKTDISSGGNAGFYLQGVAATTDYSKLGTTDPNRVLFLQPGSAGTVTIGGDTSNVSVQGDKTAKLIVHGDIKENNTKLSEKYLGINATAQAAIKDNKGNTIDTWYATKGELSTKQNSLTTDQINNINSIPTINQTVNTINSNYITNGVTNLTNYYNKTYIDTNFVNKNDMPKFSISNGILDITF